jgi:hypothetical protein
MHEFLLRHKALEIVIDLMLERIGWYLHHLDASFMEELFVLLKELLVCEGSRFLGAIQARVV